MNDQTDTSTSDSSTQPENPEATNVGVSTSSASKPSLEETPTASPSVVSSEPVVTSQTTPTNSPSKKSPVLTVILVLLVLVLIAVAGFMGSKTAKSKADKDSAALKNQITALQSDEHVLPAGAIKVSDCIPNMGSHYLPKDSDPEYGPFILVTKAGKVIGLEYMAAHDMFTAIPQTNPPVQVITKNGSLYGWKFNHTEFSHLPKGHEGLIRDHIDVHMFTVPTDEVKKSCV